MSVTAPAAWTEQTLSPIHKVVVTLEYPSDVLRNTGSDPLGVAPTQPITTEKAPVVHLMSRAVKVTTVQMSERLGKHLR